MIQEDGVGCATAGRSGRRERAKTPLPPAVSSLREPRLERVGVGEEGAKSETGLADGLVERGAVSNVASGSAGNIEVPARLGRVGVWVSKKRSKSTETLAEGEGVSRWEWENKVVRLMSRFATP